MSGFSFNFEIDSKANLEKKDSGQSCNNKESLVSDGSSTAVDSVQYFGIYRDSSSEAYKDCEQKIFGTVELEAKRLSIPSSVTEELLRDVVVAESKESGLLCVAGYRSDSKANDHALKEVTEKTDVLSGYYEGGFKIWECANDLSKYISDHVELEDFFHENRETRRGCTNAQRAQNGVVDSRVTRLQDPRAAAHDRK